MTRTVSIPPDHDVIENGSAHFRMSRRPTTQILPPPVAYFSLTLGATYILRCCLEASEIGIVKAV
jgi:hypothetical protein